MTDRELLTLAAKAAGVPAYWSDDGTLQKRPTLVVMAGGGQGTMPYEWPWNPLIDDGDALRLAVKLGIQVRCHIDGEGVGHAQAACGYVTWEEGDPYSATRRAIVRAAAEIGRAIE